MNNIYNAIQNVYNMDKTTWQEVLAELYNLVSNIDNKFDLFELKFGSLLGEQVTRELKKMYDDGSLASLINDKLLKDINKKVDTFKTEVSEQLDTIENNNFFITFKKNSNSLNDSDGLNNIIKKAKNENLKILLEKGRTYHVKNIEMLEGSFIDGNGATLKLLDCADRDIYDKLIKIKGNNCTIQNLTLDGNIDNVEGDIYTGCDLIINETGNILKNLNFKNITFQNSHYVGLNISNVDNCIVDSCRFNNLDACIISNGEHCYNLIISNCIFDGHKHSEPITIMGKTENRFININSNIIKNHTNGIAINIGREPQYDELNRSYTFDVDVSNNIIDGCSCGIQINNVERYTINSNTINSVLDGVRLMRKTKNGNITNNVISKTNRSPIVFNNSNGDVTITNNILSETNNSNMHHDYGFIYFESKSNTSIIFDYNILTEGENASSIKLNNNLNSDNVVYMRNNTLTNNLSYEYQVYFDSVKLIANNNDLFAYYGNVKINDKVNAGLLCIDNQNLSSSTLDIYNQQCYDSVFITVTNSINPKISHIPPQYDGKSIKIIFKNDNKISYGITSSSTIKLKKTYDTTGLSCLILELVCLSGIWYEVSANEIP